MPYEVRLTVFEGPLDLLLQLIQRQELDITQVSLALVTDQYLQHIQDLEVVGAKELSEFLVIAAQLLLIKSRLLLPSPPAPSSDEEEGDAGQELVQRLETYRRYKAAAQQLHTWEGSGQRAFVRAAPPAFPPPSLPPAAASPAELLTALQRILAVAPPAPTVSNVVSPIRVSITDRMSLIRESVQSASRCALHSLFSPSSSREEVIVTFLALLELVRRGEMVACQERVFGEILISAQRNPVGASQEEAPLGRD
jgi:segregation and condensation protein A